MTEQQQRLTACKVRISHLINSEFTKPLGEWEPPYIQIKDKKISRINIIATVISKYISEDMQYVSLVLDDGSESIQTKSWKEDVELCKSIEVGDLILTISKIRNYNGQNYLSPEIIKKLDDLMWLELRKKELNKLYGPITEIKSIPKITPSYQSEEKYSQKDREKILNLVEKLNSDNGADINEVILESKMNENSANKLIQELLKDGEIFEIRPGGLKIIS